MKSQKLKNILMIATGGTIASAQSGHGLSPSLTSDDLLRAVPEVSSICHVDTIQLMNLDSTNISAARDANIGSAGRQKTAEAYCVTASALTSARPWLTKRSDSETLR